MNRLEINTLIRYGWIFLIAGLVINYIYRMVFHATPIDKIIVDSDMEGYNQYLFHFFIKDWELFDWMPWTIDYGEGKNPERFYLWCGYFAVTFFPDGSYYQHFSGASC